jgi:hypothetical protein
MLPGETGLKESQSIDISDQEPCERDAAEQGETGCPYESPLEAEKQPFLINPYRR